jgi:hypothetical protein
MTSTRVYLSTTKNDSLRENYIYMSAIWKSMFPESKIIKDFSYEKSDLAVIHAYVNKRIQDMAPEEVLKTIEERGKGDFVCFRRHVIEQQKINKRHVLFSDSNFFKYKESVNKGNNFYLRYSLNGVDPTSGYYFDDEVDPLRWRQISKDFGISLKPWRKNGNSILILMQRHNGWSMNNESSIEWCINTIKEIRKYSDRNIIIRKHPRDKVKEFLVKFNQLPSCNTNVHISSNKDILDDLSKAWCTITYNSSPGIISAVEGVPTFVLDPIPARSHAFEISNTDISRIEDPLMPDRQGWIERISMSHYKVSDIQSGLLKNNIGRYIQKHEK